LKAKLITGAGIVSPVGTGRLAFFDAIRSAIQAPATDLAVESFDASKYVAPNVAEVRGFEAAKHLGDRGLRTLDRLSKLLIVASRLALADARLKEAGVWLEREAGEPPWPDRVGLVVSNAYGSLEAISELDRVALLEDPRYINPSRFPLTVSNTAAGYTSIWEEIRALNISVSDGNCGALDAVACADAMLEGARADVLLVGGAEAMSEGLFVAFERLGLRSPRGQLGPFGERVRLGEGAALVTLETAGGARARGAKALASICGFGTAFEPPSHEAALLSARSEPLEQAIQSALADAGLQAESVDLVVSGLSGLAAFDHAELGAIQRVIGADAWVLAPKLAIGETLGAAGAMGLVAAIAYLREGSHAHAVRGRFRGFRDPVRTALITSLGYYGNASALVIQSHTS
jgi:3-oxoacyl-(acyl-carrier-protein) synthase